MDLIEAIVLGAVQGLTEFLPISSSGHLILVPWLLGWPDPGKVFDVALHFGTLVALLAYYWQTWLDLLLHDHRRLGLILLGSVPGGVVGLVGSTYIEEHFGRPEQIGVALVLFGALLYLVDRFGKKTRGGEDFGWRDALLIGTAQALALFPGVSRSGITITAGLALGFRRDSAATFSFLLATPITGGAVLWAARKLLQTGIAPEERLPFVVGVLVSGVVGALAIHALLRFVRGHSYTPFVVYRVIVGLAMVVAVAIGH
jgi:undecaprenyl-diphosphatase